MKAFYDVSSLQIGIADIRQYSRFFQRSNTCFSNFFAVNLFTRLALTAFLLLYVFGDIDKCIEIIDPSL